MVIKKLRLNNFRNYEELEIEFSDGVNILFGDNAQGKTNILEGVFLAATTKSLRGSKDRDMIRFGQEEAHISAVTERAGMTHKIDMHLKKGRAKGLAVDGIPLRRSAELLGLLHTVSFSPEDLSMMNNGPEERRRFYDLELCQLDKIYCSNLADYGKALTQRNDLLKQIADNPSLKETIEVWDEQLVKFGTYLIRARKRFTEQLIPIVSEKHGSITDGAEQLKLVYEPNCTEEDFRQTLKRNLERDLILHYTSNGPHRDDLSLFINDNNVKLFGSQGQKRTTALSLKLAEIELIRGAIRETPVLLLDDVLSELDRNRQSRLLSEMEDVQTIVTCTGMEEFVACRPEGNTIYRVGGNQVNRI
ncbi:MAG: DNA replication/repair protein RecF [Lachnospiraceae bacterium]|nr:DNA replication/repair protein RecF [Lachnospiraceae bacterium]